MTLIEVVVVVAVLGAAMTLTVPFLSDSVRGRDLDAQASVAADVLNEAQSSAMSGKGERRFGVHFEARRFVLFRGATYVPADGGNDVHVLPGDVTVTSVVLTGGGSDVHFANVRGTPTENGAVVFTADDGATRTVSVNAAGMIDVE